MKTKFLIIMLAAIMGTAAFIRISSIKNAKASEVEKITTTIPEMHNWSDASKKAVNAMKQMYGEPNETTSNMMVWNNVGSWKRTVVYAKEFKHDFPLPHTDVLEQTIDYKVPVGKFSVLAMYDGSITCSRTFGEMSVRCDKEAMNILALNLADDIIKGNKNIKTARDFYAKTAWAFMKGDKHEYTQKLQFSTVNMNTGDPDEMSTLIDKDEMIKMKKQMKEREMEEEKMKEKSMNN
jgi:hypothetical protein